MDMAEIRLLSAPVILGIHMNWGLEGILLVQVYIYSARFSSDPLRIKCLVYGVFIYETVQACLLVADVFHYWVWNYGDPAVLATLSNMWFSVLIMGGILATLVQCFYAWRIWNTVKHVFISVPIIMVAFTQLALAVTSGVKARLLPIGLESRIASFVDAWLACALLANIIISITMIVHFVKNNRHAGSSPVSRMLTFIVESGALLAIFTLVELILFIVEPQTNLHLLFAILSSKLYANTLLISFNNRTPPTTDARGFFSDFRQSSDTRLGSYSDGSHSLVFAKSALSTGVGLRSHNVKETILDGSSTE